MAIKAIPTEYGGIRFRSRLEARWAAMFDKLGWKWHYEPLDFDGYIPDFLLQFARDEEWGGIPKEIFVEVKPVTAHAILLSEHFEKAFVAGVPNLLAVGAYPFGPVLGIFSDSPADRYHGITTHLCENCEKFNPFVEADREWAAGGTSNRLSRRRNEFDEDYEDRCISYAELRKEGLSISEVMTGYADIHGRCLACGAASTHTAFPCSMFIEDAWSSAFERTRWMVN